MSVLKYSKSNSMMINNIKSFFRKVNHRLNKLSVLGKLSLFWLIALLGIAIFGEHLIPHSHKIPEFQALLEPNKVNLLGTDDLGIDLLSQILYGARISMGVGLSVAFISVIIGSVAGGLAGYYQGRVDGAIMRVADAMLVIPRLPLTIVIAAFMGPSIYNIILVLSLFSWASVARIVRSLVLALMHEGYIIMAKTYGGGFCYIFRNHIISKIAPVLAINFMKVMGSAITAEAGLAFIGLSDPTTRSWGVILNHAMAFKGIYFTEFWKWWIVSPVVFMTLTMVSIAFLGRELEGKNSYGKSK